MHGNQSHPEWISGVFGGAYDKAGDSGLSTADLLPDLLLPKTGGLEFSDEFFPVHKHHYNDIAISCKLVLENYFCQEGKNGY